MPYALAHQHLPLLSIRMLMCRKCTLVCIQCKVSGTFMYSITYYIIQKYLHIHYCCRWWNHISCKLHETWQCFLYSHCNQSHNFNTLCMLQKFSSKMVFTGKILINFHLCSCFIHIWRWWPENLITKLVFIFIMAH